MVSSEWRRLINISSWKFFLKLGKLQHEIQFGGDTITFTLNYICICLNGCVLVPKCIDLGQVSYSIWTEINEFHVENRQKNRRKIEKNSPDSRGHGVIQCNNHNLSKQPSIRSINCGDFTATYCIHHWIYLSISLKATSNHYPVVFRVNFACTFYLIKLTDKHYSNLFTLISNFSQFLQETGRIGISCSSQKLSTT